MIHIIFCDHSHLYRIFLIRFFQGNGIAHLQSKQACRLLRNSSPFVGKLIFFLGNTALQGHIPGKIFQIFRHKQINADIRAALMGTDLRQLDLVAMGNLLIALHIFQKLCPLFLCGIAVLDHHTFIMLQIPILNGGNITDGILDSKSNQHQSHTSCNSKNRHDQTFLISEKISDGRFPGKAQMLPYKRNPLQKHTFALFWSRRTHKGCRCLLQFFSTRKKSGANGTHNRCPGSNQCKTELIINGNGICHIVIHNSIGRYNNVRNDLLANQHSQNTSQHSCKKRITDVFRRNRSLLISQSLQSTDLGSLLLHHTGHGSKTDQCRYQEKDHRENLANVSKAVCIVTIIRVFRKVLTVCDYPLRYLQISQFLPGIV